MKFLSWTDYTGNAAYTTDNNGKVTARFFYTPYGELADQIGDDIYRKGYNQKEHNRKTGLTFFDARYYAPELGRFILCFAFLPSMAAKHLVPSCHMPDDRFPDMYNEQSLNVYSYVCGSPVEFRDWSGHSKVGNFFKDVGKSIGKGVQRFAQNEDMKYWRMAAYAVGTAAIIGLAVLTAGPLGVGLTAMVGATMIGAGFGFIVGGTRGRIFTEPGSAFDDFDMEKAFQGAFYGAALGYAGQAVPALLGKIGSGSGLSNPVYGNINKLNEALSSVYDKVPYSKEFTNAVAPALKEIGLTAGSVEVYRNGINNVYNHYNGDETKVSLVFTYDYKGPNTGQVSLQFLDLDVVIVKSEGPKEEEKRERE